MEQCISCKRSVVNREGVTKFDCPSCGNYQIVRCGHCRKIVAKYTCPQCNFVGPN